MNGDPPRRLMEPRILICAKSLNFTTNQWLSDRPARPITSVAHCRAALEQALKERLGLQLTGVFITFQDLLTGALQWNVFDDSTENIARDEANAADEVMREKPADLRKAGEVLAMARLLQHILGRKPVPA